MSLSLMGGLGASATEIVALIDGIDRIMPFILAVRPNQRFRSIIADDVQSEGALFSPPAFAVIRGGSVSTFPVGANTIAIDGRKIRSFEPVWDDIVDALGLSGDAKIAPVAEITSRDVSDSIARLSAARDSLVELLPEREAAIAKKSKSSILKWLLLGAGALYIKTKIA